MAPSSSSSSKRARVASVMKDPSLTFQEKNRRAQAIYSEGVGMTPEVVSNQKDDHNGNGRFDRTFRRHGSDAFGCQHYKRNCRIKAECCGTFFTCRLCHDESCRHKIDRFAMKTMVCMFCHTVQPIASHCTNKVCGKQMASYFCAKCRLFDDDYPGDIFHCDDCGLCRKAERGEFYHCKKCNTCMSVTAKHHLCLESSLDSNCPVCNEYLFTSMRPITFPDCRHPMHADCLAEYSLHSYTCPVCMRSLWQNDEYIRRVDAHVANDSMPSEFEGYVSEILCNDCLDREICKFHFLYHKCTQCGSYNTRVLRSGPAPLPPVQQLVAEATPSSASLPPLSLAAAAAAPSTVVLSPRAASHLDALQQEAVQNSLPVVVGPSMNPFSSPRAASPPGPDQESPPA